MASRPESSGSSEKHSKCRPPSGERCRLIVGPRTTSTPLRTASPASASPIRRQQVLVPGRRHAPSPTAARPTARARCRCRPRTPTGPSETVIDAQPDLRHGLRRPRRRRRRAAAPSSPGPASPTRASSRGRTARCGPRHSQARGGARCTGAVTGRAPARRGGRR